MAEHTKMKRYRFLKDSDYSIIHKGACRILEETGIIIENKKAIEIFEKAGAKYEDGRVKIPQSLVDDAIKKTSKQIIMGAKDENHRLNIDVNNPIAYFGTGGQALYVLHYKDGEFERKPAVSQDLVDIVSLCDKLDNCDFLTRPVEPDAAEEEMDLTKTKIFLENTSKHINLANLIQIDKLEDIINEVKDKSWISFISCVLVSPMKWADDTADKFMKIVENDIPVSISSCPQAGATSPLSEVGEIMQVNAEILSAVVLGNLVRPGAKLLYRGIPITSNLHTDLSPRWCQPDSIRRVAIIAEMTQYYGIPCCGTAAVSDEKEPNAQTVSEKTLSYIYEGASGAQFINSALGMLEQVMTVSPEQYIIDDIILGHVRKLFSENPDKSPDKIAKQAIPEVLKIFGVDVDADMEQEITNRIDFVQDAKEEYTEETMDAQCNIIHKALVSGSAGTKFMKSARAGLRKGLLYSGSRFDQKIDLTEVLKRKIEILG